MLKNFLGCENLCINLSHFIFHLIVARSEKKRRSFYWARRKRVPDKEFDMRISIFKKLIMGFCRCRDAHVRSLIRQPFSMGLSKNRGLFFLSMLQSNDKWNVKASYIGFHNPENFWASEISTSLEISIKWINSNISIIKCLYYGIFE